MYTSEPIPRPTGPPASATPLRDFLSGATLGVSERYVVLPRSLAESMPLPWQQQMAHLIEELHQTYGELPWPLYRVVPSRTERLVDLDEGTQEWRYRHVKMVERTIGDKAGTGGSSGAKYLRETLFRPMFPDLWAVRSEL